MASRALLSVVFFALSLPTTIYGAPPNQLERRGVCQSGIYGEIAPILAGYSVAQAYCSAHYPVQCTPAVHKRAAPSTTTTKTTTTTAVVKTTTKTTTTTTTTKPATTTTTKTSSVNPTSSAWSKCQNQPGNVISTLCSCIEHPAVCFLFFTFGSVSTMNKH